MKKIIAVLMAAVTALMLSIPAFASENVIDDELVDYAVETAVNAVTDENIVLFDGMDWLIDEVKESSGRTVSAALNLNTENDAHQFLFGLFIFNLEALKVRMVF